LIFDENLLKLMEQDFDTRNRVFPHTRFTNPHDTIKAYLNAGNGNFYEADSIENLCEQTGIDIENLKNTFQTYNEYCRVGYDALFNKKQQYLRTITHTKLYAARHFPSAYGSAGGIKINEKAEVIGQDWKPIEGFYAAGTDACSIYGDSYPFIFSGTSMGFALNTGRMAAESIANKYKTS
jgi:fumarate reductase flavoprotein subunit